MKKASLVQNIHFQEEKPKVEMLLETAFTKEIRITFQKGQLMKEHTAPQPIVVEIFEGTIEFGVNGEKHTLTHGDMVTLDAKVPHDLLATEQSVVRLTLSKGDQVNRVQEVVNQ